MELEYHYTAPVLAFQGVVSVLRPKSKPQLEIPTAAVMKRIEPFPQFRINYVLHNAEPDHWRSYYNDVLYSQLQDMDSVVSELRRA